MAHKKKNIQADISRSWLLFAATKVDNFDKAAASGADQLVLATTKDVPLRGDMATVTVPVGVDRWLVVARSPAPLVGSFASLVPWMLLIVGLATALLAGAVVEEVAIAVGRVLADAALILDPEQIVIGGSLTRAAPSIVTRVGEIVAAELEPVGGAVPLIRAAKLGDDDGARGAIAALFRQSPLLAGYPGPVGSNR